MITAPTATVAQLSTLDVMLNHLHDKKWVKTFKDCKRLDYRIALLRNYNTDTQQEEAIIQHLLNKLDPPKPSVTKVDQVRFEMTTLEAKGQMVGDKDLNTKEGERYWQDRLDEAEAQDVTLQKALMKEHAKALRQMSPELIDSIEEAVEKATTPTINLNMKTGRATIHSEGEHDLIETAQADKLAVADDVPAVGKYEEVAEPVSPKAKKEKEDPVADDLKEVPGLNATAIKALKLAKITTMSQLLALTYEEALAIVKSQPALAKISKLFRKE